MMYIVLFTVLVREYGCHGFVAFFKASTQDNFQLSLHAKIAKLGLVMENSVYSVCPRFLHHGMKVPALALFKEETSVHTYDNVNASCALKSFILQTNRKTKRSSI